jgi:hypothetical protein
MAVDITAHRSMDVAYEILSSVFGFFPTMDGYESMAGTQSRHMIGDAAIFKLTNEFTPRNEEHDYMEAGFNKDARFVAKQWELNGNKPLEQTYWAYTPNNNFHSQLDGGNLQKELTELMEAVLDNGKALVGSNWEDIDLNLIQHMNLRDKVVGSATSPFTNALADDIRNSDWYETLLVPLASPLSGPIYFGHEYDALQRIIKLVSSENNSNLYHAVMQFPVETRFVHKKLEGKAKGYTGYIAVMPYMSGIISYSNMALLEIIEIDDDPFEPLGSIRPSFGEDAFSKWKELRPETRYQSINKRIVSETK